MDDLPKILEGIEGKFIETSRIKVFTRFTPKIQVRNAFYKEVSIIGLNSYSKTDIDSDFETALRLLAEKKVNVQKIITHTFNLDQFDAALDLVKSKSEAVKIVFQNQ